MVVLQPTALVLMPLRGSIGTVIQPRSEDYIGGRVVALYAMAFMGMMPWGPLWRKWGASVARCSPKPRLPN